jgi:ribosomal protein S12 methylthiotransferase
MAKTNRNKHLIDVISMGCSKNLVDSERLIRHLEAKGYNVNFDPETPSGEYVVINTCGFIGDAKEESINMILSICELKQKKKVEKIVVMGCLSERYLAELKSELPEVDYWYGKFDWKAFYENLPIIEKTFEEVKQWDRTLTTPSYSAYIKISEGCNRFCAFCAIPLITGRHTSRSKEEILEEVKRLVSGGVKEFNIIAQDLSSYGTDLYGRSALAELIDEMATIKGVEWIRLHYAYPADFPYDILPVMAKHTNVCKYLDIALQHISDNVLTAMRRHIDKKGTLELIKRIRKEVPGIAIRTTLMVGFPGETETDFNELVEFVKTAKFDRMGAFAYSEEDDTYAAKNLTDNVPQEVKQERLDKIMALQQQIAEELNAAHVGNTIKVLIERAEGEYVVGRSQYDSPEVDQEIYIKESNAKPGEFINVKIEQSAAFELYGTEI